MHTDTDEKVTLMIRLAAAGLRLPAARADALLPGLRRLEATARWLRALDLDFSEPALVLDVQSHGETLGRE